MSPQRAGGAGPQPLVLPDLLNDFAALQRLLSDELRAAREARDHPVRAQHILDAYLLAAGAGQLLDDYLHRELEAVAAVARRTRGTDRTLVQVFAGSARLVNRIGWGSRLIRTRQTRTLSWRRSFGVVVERLADATLAARRPPKPEGLAERGLALTEELDEMSRLMERAPRFPASLRRAVVRLPDCFRSFDQQPEDCEQLAERLATRVPDLATPLLVVGIRTSGSYLAPLQLATLRSRGYQRVTAITMRPGQAWLSSERRLVDAVVRAGGLALLVDDPPVTGAKLATAAEQLEGMGFSQGSIILALQLLGPSEALPVRLRRYPAVLLPWPEWAINRKLSEEAVGNTLMALLPGGSVRVLSRAPLPPIEDVKARPIVRSHLRARYRIQLIERGTEKTVERDVYVKGTGLGYFGRYSMAVAGRLQPFLPNVYGWQDGLLYRAYLPEENRLSSIRIDEPRAAIRIASYVAARAQALRVAEDVSLRLVRRHPLWQLCSDELGRAFGGAALFIRPLLHRVARHLVAVAQPAVVDGSMTLSQWFGAPDAGGLPAAGGLLKVDFDERAFSVWESYAYDPVFDLAIAAADAQALAKRRALDTNLPSLLRHAYQSLANGGIGDERWLLYQLVHLRGYQGHFRRLLRQGSDPLQTAAGAPPLTPVSQPEAAFTGSVLAALDAGDRARSQIVNGFLGDQLCADLSPPASGPVCVIAIDGVLEAQPLSFPALSPAAALAVRALVRHGYRPLLTTSNTPGELRVLCLTLRLPGGVAERGSATYNHRSGRVISLVDDRGRSALDQLRSALAARTGVYLDGSRRFSVRAFQLNQDGDREPLPAALVNEALVASGAVDALQVIDGSDHTDVLARGADSAVAVRALITDLGGPVDEPTDGTWLALAVGGSAADLPLLRAAARPFVVTRRGEKRWPPAPLDRFRATRRVGSAGMLEAVSAFLGHDPTSCATCRPPRSSLDARLVLGALAAQDASMGGKLTHALDLAIALARARGTG